MSSLARQLFRPATGVLALWLLAAVALGGAADWVVVSNAPGEQILTTEFLSVAMVVWMLCGVAMCTMRRRQRGELDVGSVLADIMGFTGVFAVMAFAACALSDGVLFDGLRAVVLAWCFYPLGVALGLGLTRRNYRSIVMTALLFSVVGLAAMGYFHAEFGLGGLFQVAGDASPVMLAWQSGSILRGAWLPESMAVCLGWLTAGVLLCGVMLRRPRRV